MQQLSKEEYIKAFPNIMYHMDEPLADPACPALYFGIKEASKYVKVIKNVRSKRQACGGACRRPPRPRGSRGIPASPCRRCNR